MLAKYPRFHPLKPIKNHKRWGKGTTVPWISMGQIYIFATPDKRQTSLKGLFWRASRRCIQADPDTGLRTLYLAPCLNIQSQVSGIIASFWLVVHYTWGKSRKGLLAKWYPWIENSPESCHSWCQPLVTHANIHLHRHILKHVGITTNQISYKGTRNCYFNRLMYTIHIWYTERL